MHEAKEEEEEAEEPAEAYIRIWGVIGGVLGASSVQTREAAVEDRGWREEWEYDRDLGLFLRNGTEVEGLKEELKDLDITEKAIYIILGSLTEFAGIWLAGWVVWRNALLLSRGKIFWKLDLGTYRDSIYG